MTRFPLQGAFQGRRVAFAAAALFAFCLAGCKSPSKEEVIASLEKETGKKAQTTPSGLAYIIAAEGSGAAPTLEERVKVDYTGKLLNGKKFDSSKDAGQPATLRMRQLIKGWQEGLQLIKPGGKIWLVIPYQLAYGDEALPGIPAQSTLVFEIDLLGIEK